MKITIENTAQIVDVNGVPARVWVGQTEGGIKIECLVTRIAVPRAEDCSQFERELTETPAPYRSECWPLRMIL